MRCACWYSRPVPHTLVMWTWVYLKKSPYSHPKDGKLSDLFFFFPIITYILFFCVYPATEKIGGKMDSKAYGGRCKHKNNFHVHHHKFQLFLRFRFPSTPERTV